MSKLIVILISLLCLPAIYYFLLGGFEPHDLHHLADIHQMRAATMSGQFPPRLGPDFLFGAGYPLFNFYYVLPFYLGAFFYQITGSLMVAFQLVLALSVFVSAFGMCAFLSKFFSRWASIAGALLYVYTPFRAVELYVRGAIGEALAIAIFPWVLYFLTTLIEQTTKRNIAKLAIIVALFLLTHNYFFMLVAPYTAIFVLLLVYKKKEKLAKIGSLVIAGLLGLGLAAYWWLPAFLEHKLVASTTPFALEDHFPFVKQLISPSWGYGSSVWGPGDELSFQIGIVNLVVVAAALFFIVKRREIKKINFKISLLALVFFFTAVFMMNIRSLPVWNLVPFTNFIQFPWRLLTLTTFFTAFLASFVVENFKNKKLFTLILLTFCLLLTISYFRPSKLTHKSDEEYIKRFFSNLQYSEDYLQLPHSTKIKFDREFPQKFDTGENAVLVNYKKINDVNWKATIKSDSATEVQVYVLNFPGWFVEMDGVRVETYASPPYGQLTFVVPGSGLYEVELYWAETDLRLLANVISLTSLVLIIFLLLPRGVATFVRATI